MNAPTHLETIRAYDYLHVAKVGDRWFIVNVLWEVREGETEP